MKKLIISIVLVCYLAVSSGVVVNFHYCMNKLASTEWFATKNDRCGKCGMSMHKAFGCCHDEVKIVKMDDDQQLTPALSFELQPLDVLYSIPSEFITTAFFTIPGQKHYRNHSPPLLSAQDSYLRNGVFRI